MSNKFTPLTTANLGGSISSITSAIDINFSNLSSLINDTLSRSGVFPNQMTTPLDMNGNLILNLPVSGSLNYYTAPSFTAGDLLIVGSAGQVVDSSTLGNNNYANLPTGLKITNNIFLNRDQGNTPDTTWLFMNTGFGGSTTVSSAIPVVYIGVSNYLNAMNSSQNCALLVKDSLTAGHAGAATALVASINEIGATAAPAGNAGKVYLGAQITASSNQNNGGTPGLTNCAGEVVGLNPGAFLSSGATNFYTVNGMEIDIASTAGSSSVYKIGMLIVLSGGDAVQGSGIDAGIDFSTGSSSSLGWNIGIAFGKPDGNAAGPISSTGSILAAALPSVSHGSVTSYSIKNGIDLTNFTFSGAPYLAPLQTPSSSSATGIKGSICWDANYIYICTATNTWKQAALTTF